MAAARTNRSRAYRFAAEINQWYERNASIYGGGREWVIQVVLDLLSEIVDRTPVKSGRARANWRVGLGAPPRGTTRQVDVVGNVTVRNGLLVLQSMTGVPGQVWLANNVPYALRLERGSSSQAPYGMVALAIEAIGQKYRVSGAGLGQFVTSNRERGHGGPAAARGIAA